MAAPRILRKFPLNLALGTDICHVARIRRILSSSSGHRFVKRILNDNERAHPKIQWLFKSATQANGSPKYEKTSELDPVSSAKMLAEEASDDPSPLQSGPGSQDIQVAAAFMAGRFSAKEAVIKAHPHRALTWHDITIQRQASAHPRRKGAPVAIIRGQDEDHEALISISHEEDYATAVCLAVGQT
ncbi:unnamed protein product [Discula destructiva]